MTNENQEIQEIKNNILEFLTNYLKEHSYFKKRTLLISFLKLLEISEEYNDLRIFLSKIINKLYRSGVLVKHSNTVYRVKYNNNDIIKKIIFSTPYISNSKIRDLFLKKRLNLTEISKIVGCNITTISKRLKDMKIDPSRNVFPEKKLSISNKRIKELYLKEKMSMKKISEIALCTSTTILRRLRKMGVELRNQNNNRLKISNERIKYLYINEGMNLTEISKIANCSSQVIRSRLKSMDVKIRKYKKLNISNEQTKELYLKEKMSISKISKIAGCNPGTLRNRLNLMDVKIRK